jgi:hypothetical protein
MPNVQRRLPGEQWSAFSTKTNKSAFSPGQSEPEQGQLFSTKPFQQEQAPPSTGYKWGRPADRPLGPDPKMASEQPELTKFQKPTAPSPFADKGVGKYVVKNGNGLQFNKPAVKSAVAKGVQAYGEAQYFRHSGMGAAMRHTLGMPQMPSHMNDYLRSRHNTSVRGQDPHSISAQLGAVDPDEYMHF